jgi:hypothetical protein
MNENAVIVRDLVAGVIGAAIGAAVAVIVQDQVERRRRR